MDKTVINIEYDTLQSQSGHLSICGERKEFYKIEVSGNNLILYAPDNGFSKHGRLGGVYDLKEYELEFLN